MTNLLICLLYELKSALANGLIQQLQLQCNCEDHLDLDLQPFNMYSTMTCVETSISI